MKSLNLFNKLLINSILGTSLIPIIPNIAFAQPEESTISLEAFQATSDLYEIDPFELGEFTSVTFDSFFNNDNILIKNTSGKFKDWLGEPTSETFNIPATSIFLMNKRPIINFKEDNALYEVRGEAIFDFSEQLIDNIDNVIELMWIIPVGTTFIYSINFPFVAPELYLSNNSTEKPFWKTGIDLNSDGIVDKELIWNSDSNFNILQIGSANYGDYGIQSTVTTVVPEPLTVLGVVSAIAFGTIFKCKVHRK